MDILQVRSDLVVTRRIPGLQAQSLRHGSLEQRGLQRL